MSRARFIFRSGRPHFGRCARRPRRRRSSCIAATGRAPGSREHCCAGEVPATSACSKATWPGGGARARRARGTLIVMAASPLPRLRRLCLALPEAHEVIAWGEPTFRVRNKMFATFASAANHHGRGPPRRLGEGAAGEPGPARAVGAKRVFVPPYVGPSGWIGLYLDDVADWDEIRRLLREGYLLVAPKRLAAQVGGGRRRRRAAAGAAGPPRSVHRAIRSGGRCR